MPGTATFISTDTLSSQTVTPVPSKVIRAECTVPSFKLMPSGLKSVCAMYKLSTSIPTELSLTSQIV